MRFRRGLEDVVLIDGVMSLFVRCRNSRCRTRDTWIINTKSNGESVFPTTASLPLHPLTVVLRMFQGHANYPHRLAPPSSYALPHATRNTLDSGQHC